MSVARIGYAKYSTYMFLFVPVAPVGLFLVCIVGVKYVVFCMIAGPLIITHMLLAAAFHVDRSHCLLWLMWVCVTAQLLPRSRL